jgi:hypothetical protein
MCRRVEGEGCIPKKDINGLEYFLYIAKNNSRSFPLAIVRHSTKQTAVASDEDLHRFYLKMLMMMPLTFGHRNHLRQRGLNDEVIEAAQYRSFNGRERIGIANELLSVFGENLASKVPGMFFQNKQSRSFWSIAGTDGILIPIRDFQGRIVSISIRTDNPSDKIGKYILMSSKRHGGPGPGLRIHVPLQVHKLPKSVVRITEGILKSDTATALSGIPTIGLNGLNGLHQTFEILKEWKNESVS